jgi:hypothetical protein
MDSIPTIAMAATCRKATLKRGKYIRSSPYIKAEKYFTDNNAEFLINSCYANHGPQVSSLMGYRAEIAFARTCAWFVSINGMH